MKRLILLAASTTLLATSVFAKSHTINYDTKQISAPDVTWQQIGPGMSGYNETFICHPTDPDTYFLGPDMRVTYGSWDGAKSWHSIKDQDGTGRDLEWLLDIKFSMQNPDHGYAISYMTYPNTCEFYETTDKGHSWTHITNVGKVHRELAVHPKNDKIIFIGAGDFWNIKDNIRSLKNIHGKKQTRAEYGHILKSKDGGRTWRKVATNISPDMEVGRILFNPKNPDQMIMASGHGVYASNDCGETWQPSSKGLVNNQPRDLTIYTDPKSGAAKLFLVEQTIYEKSGNTATSKGGIFRSDDFGKSWVDISGDLNIDMAKASDFSDKAGYYKTLSNWFGEDLKSIKSELSEMPSKSMPTWNRLVVNPLNSNEIYVSHNKKMDRTFGAGDVWKSVDGGETWKPVVRFGSYWTDGKFNKYWEARGVATNMNTTFGHVHPEMIYATGYNSGLRHLVINTRGEVFIGIAQQTFVTKNGGETWEQIDDYELTPGSNQWVGRGDSNMPGRVFMTETGVDGRLLFCSGEHGIFKSVDLGNYPDKNAVAFEQIEGQIRPKAAHSIATAAVHPQNPDIIYTLQWRQEHRGQVRRTLDGGKSWENIARIFDCASAGHMGLAPQASLMFDYKNPDNIYFCATRNIVQEVGGNFDSRNLTMGEYGVYRSTDGGFTWSTANKGLPANCSVRRLTMDPKNPQIIYASLNQRIDKDVAGGLYISTDGAKSWSKVKGVPVSITSVNDLSINKKTGDMYLSAGTKSGTSAGGVWCLKSGAKGWEQLIDSPSAWHTESSEVDPRIIIATIPGYSTKDKGTFKNPGIYVSKDGGKSWLKSNNGIGQPDKIVEVKCDPKDATILWCASWGCGWYKGLIK